MIDIKDLCFYYNDKRIFDDINIRFCNGEFYSIIGPNGSGKTTLLKLLLRRLRYSRGSIILDDMDLYNYDRREFAKKIAVLPQENGKLSVSVYDYIASGRYPYIGSFGQMTSEHRNIVNASARYAGIDFPLDKNMLSLSGGERQRVYIAAVLAQSTPYILLDEPTTYLDISARFEIMSLLRTLPKEGKTVIAVLHDLGIALKSSDSVLILDKEKGICEMMTPSEAVSSGLINEVFNICCEEIYLSGRKEFVIYKK